jgi:hypothetical protein
LNYLPRLALNHESPVQVARISGVSHWPQLYREYLKQKNTVDKSWTWIWLPWNQTLALLVHDLDKAAKSLWVFKLFQLIRIFVYERFFFLNHVGK